MICDPTHYPKSKIHLKVNLYILYIFLPSFSSVYIKKYLIKWRLFLWQK